MDSFARRVFRPVSALIDLLRTSPRKPQDTRLAPSTDGYGESGRLSNLAKHPRHIRPAVAFGVSKSLNRVANILAFNSLPIDFCTGQMGKRD